MTSIRVRPAYSQKELTQIYPPYLQLVQVHLVSQRVGLDRYIDLLVL